MDSNKYVCFTQDFQNLWFIHFSWNETLASIVKTFHKACILLIDACCFISKKNTGKIKCNTEDPPVTINMLSVLYTIHCFAAVSTNVSVKKTCYFELCFNKYCVMCSDIYAVMYLRCKDELILIYSCGLELSACKRRIGSMQFWLVGRCRFRIFSCAWLGLD